MSKQPDPSKYHGDIVLVGHRDHLPIPHRAAGLHGGAYPGLRRLINAVAEREEGIRTQCRGRCDMTTVVALCTARRRHPRDICPAPMPIVAPSRTSTIAFDLTDATARQANNRSVSSVDEGALVTTTFHDLSSITAGRTLLHEQSAADALVVQRVRRPLRASLQNAQVLLAAEDLQCAGREAGRHDALHEQARHRLGCGVVDGRAEGDDRAEDRPSGMRAAPPRPGRMTSPPGSAPPDGYP